MEIMGLGLVDVCVDGMELCASVCWTCWVHCHSFSGRKIGWLVA